MSAKRPLPLPDDQTREFWDGCANQELRLQCCEDCETYIHQPAAMCHACNSTRLNWKRVSGNGEVYSWVVVYQAPASYDVPYVVGWIELVEQPGLRILSNVVGCPPDQVQAGMQVQVEFEALADGVNLPVFRPV
ncbi:OB-fold domain-containing protein [Myxococcota bacterium]|nr:OB-fold domain-containing protein [Myxococcota bacterium]